MKSRILIVFSGFIFLWGLLVLRAAYLQFLPNQRLKALESRQFQTTVALNSRRGAIVDRNGRELAISTTAYSIFADPKLIENKKATAKKLAKHLGVSPEHVFQKIKDGKKRFVWIQRLIDKSTTEDIKDLEIKGVSVVEEYRRIYPNDQLLSQTLGFVGQEGQGLEGLELQFEGQLRGNKKKVAVKRDARGRPLIADGMIFSENPDGAEIKLTVDAEIQHVLENELSEAVSNFEADQAYGVILDANTSAILAMATLPTVNANRATKSNPEYRRNRVLTDAFEPGSTMKAFVVAGALREKIIAPNTKYNTENGMMKIGDRVIREAEAKDKWQQLTVSEILAYSSNIGTAKIGFDLGAEKLRQAFLDFGFGQKLGMDLPGEAKGTVLPLPWQPHLLSNIAFGQGIAATPLQIANAYAAIANGGILREPFIVQSVSEPESGKNEEHEVKEIRRVLSAEDSSAMRLLLSGVTAPGGTGVNAKVDGFIVAGKTGTAQKVNPNGRGYLPNGYISSFAGFIPAADPKYVIYVAVDHPKAHSYYGSQVAAPIFSRLAGYVARKEGLAPLLLTEKNLLPTKPKEQRKSPPKPVAVEQDNFETIPDLRNLSAREVLRKLGGHDLQVKIKGEGLVSEVEPAIGQPIPEDKKITVILK